MGFIRSFTNFILEKEINITFLYLFLMAIIPFFSLFVVVHLFFNVFLKQNEWYFKGLVYLILLKSLNSFFHPPTNNFFILYVGILFIIFSFQIIKTSKFKYTALEKRLYILLLIFAIASAFGSMYVDLSLTRIIIMLIIVFVIFQSFQKIGDFNTLNFLNKITIIIILASVPMMMLKQGYLLGGPFFQGIFNHSQDFALLLLPIYTIYLISIISNKWPRDIFNYSVLFLGFMELIMSASRSAVFAFILAMVVYVLFQKTKKINKKSIIGILFVSFLLIISVIIKGDFIEKKITSFVLKYDAPGVKTKLSENNILASRKELLDVSIKNFKQYPLTGIGFNVQLHYAQSFMEFHWREFAKYIPGTKIMYSRPLEKGNLYVAVFEEGGIIAGLYFLYILLYLFRILYRSGQSFLWVPYLAMLANMNGEASFFSVMGPGNFQVLLFAWFYNMAKQYKKKRK